MTLDRTLIEQLESIAAELGGSLTGSRKALTDAGFAHYALNLPGHLHHLYFAMAAQALPDAKNILELGTGLGESTIVLSSLFPAAHIYTIDLPKEDREYIYSWRKRKAKYIERFNKNIARPNVIFIESNTLFLPTLDLPDNFEFIWVDGGHTYPAVAWDTMYAYGHLAAGGFMFMHDYSLDPTLNLQVKKVVDYMTGRIKEKILILPCCSNLKISEHAKTVCIRKGIQ